MSTLPPSPVPPADASEPAGAVVETFRVKLTSDGWLALADLCCLLGENGHDVINHVLCRYEAEERNNR